ncbi:MAG: AsmA family protein, partial [Gammaproteobacteria bacterium]|nr:AsmA family protein [Gammaproteobacteria bacterium]
MLKFLLWLMGLTLSLIVAALVIIPLVFDPNDYHDTITEMVKTQTGRELIIGDDISLSVFPWLGIELGNLTLSNSEGFGPEPMASIQGAQVKVKLLPLLRSQVEMDTLTLDGLQLYLGRNHEGKGNWEDLSAAAGEETPTTAPTSKGSPAVALTALAISGVQISNGTIVWNDESTGQKLSLENIQLSSGLLSLDAPIPLKLKFELSSKQPELSGSLEFQG